MWQCLSCFNKRNLALHILHILPTPQRERKKKSTKQFHICFQNDSASNANEARNNRQQEKVNANLAAKTKKKTATKNANDLCVCVFVEGSKRKKNTRIYSNGLLSLFFMSNSFIHNFFCAAKLSNSIFMLCVCVCAVENVYAIGSYVQGSPWDILNYLLGESHIKTTS